MSTREEVNKRARENYARRMADPEYREAQKAKGRAYAATGEGREALRVRSLRHARGKVARVAKLKQETPCADCGKNYHAVVMDFDHVRGEKTGNVAELVRRASWARVQAEIDKCDLVCANCHRMRSLQRREEAGPRSYPGQE